MSLADFSSEVILRFGTPEQKKKYLIPVTQGEFISAGAYTEPDHGSDITLLMATTALKQGDSFVINGTKTFITNGSLADFFVVLCQTDPSAKPPYRGQCTFSLKREQRGCSATEIMPKMGIRMTSTAQLSFSDVRVPLTHLLGEENKGFYQVLEFFDESRIEIAAQALGIAQGAFDRALDYAKQGSSSERDWPIFRSPSTSWPIWRQRLRPPGSSTYKAAWNYDQKRIDPKLTSMAKMFAGKTAVEVADEAIQILGGYGYITEYEVERFYRDAKITEIYEGTKEIQKNTIASALIGKLK